MNREGRRIVRSRSAAGAVLLVLIAHAFVASATHFHASFVRVNGPAQTALQSRDAKEQNAPLNGDASCFLCRLQRNFISGVQQSTPALVAPPAVAVKHELLQSTPVPAAAAPIRAGRAPPLA